MWQACRAAALQRLARSATSASSISSASASSSALLRGAGSNAHALRLNPRATAAAGAGVGQRHWALAQFSSSARPSREQPLAVHGIALVDLAKRSRRDLEDEFGADKLRRARQALPQTWDDLLLKQQQEDEYEEHDESDEIDNEPPVSRDVAKQIFMAALKQQLPQLALSVFEYMDAAFPTQVDFVVYGEVFTLLSRAGKADETLAVFERNKSLYSDDRSAPELIYRFGVFGKLGKKDFVGVEELLDEMESFGIELSNELKSRIMIAYAKNGDSDKVLEIYESLDPQVGRWHEADVDRVINSMGLIHYADEAFEFYRNAQIKLTGNTILALLNVCRENDRPKHAMAILANRKRFNLVLNTREYNKVLETLEQFEEHSEIRAILDEMTQNGVRFDKLTKMIIARNEQHLQGTAYGGGSSHHQSSSPATNATAGFVSGREQQSDASEYEDGDLKLSEQESRRKMQEFNASKAFAMAAGLADMHMTPQASHGDEDDNVNSSAMTISPFLAAEAVAAYANSGEHAKVKALLKGFAAVKGDFGHALTYIISFYSKKGDHAMVYNAFKAVQFHGRDIYRVKEALERFLEFKDPEATMTLFHQAFQQIAVALEENGNDFAKLKKQLSFDRANLVKVTLQVLIENQQLDDVVEVLDTLEARGFHVRTSDYTTIFRLMREQQSQHPTNKVAGEFETLWDDMARRGVSPSKAILAHSCVALASGSKAQQQRLLDAYAQVQSLQDDSYNIPPVCYSALLSATANLSDLSAVQKLFDEALLSLQEAKKSNPKIRFFPRNWVSTLVAKLAASEESQDANATADHVFQHVKKMKKHCGGYAYDTLLTALRVCAIANKRDQVVQLRAFFADAKCRLSLGDAEQLVRVAKEKNSFALAMLAIELFEEGNVVVSASKAVKTPEVVTPKVSETLEVSETESSPQAPAVKSFQMQKKPSAPVLKKIREMYDAALSLSEQQQGTNDIATAFLTARKAELAAMK